MPADACSHKGLGLNDELKDMRFGRRGSIASEMKR